MFMKRYFQRELRVEDIEDRGGAFIKRDTLEKGIVGNVEEGTLYFGEGDCTEILVHAYPAGGTKIIGPARRTKTGYRAYLRLMGVFETLENDPGYSRHATMRQLLAGVFNLLLFVIMISCAVDIIRMDMVNPVPGMIHVSLKLVLFMVVWGIALVSRRA